MSASKARGLVVYSQCEACEYFNCYFNCRMIRCCKISLQTYFSVWRHGHGVREARVVEDPRPARCSLKMMINISMCEGDGIDVMMEGQCTHF